MDLLLMSTQIINVICALNLALIAAIGIIMHVEGVWEEDVRKDTVIRTNGQSLYINISFMYIHAVHAHMILRKIWLPTIGVITFGKHFATFFVFLLVQQLLYYFLTTKVIWIEKKFENSN